jgi:2-oxoisovalerate dehydrogenase E2 component (dihydrolipoyl transacylase)
MKKIEAFLVPQPGEGIAEITIREWLVAPGAKVKEFDKLCEAFSDKSSIDIKSPFEGVIKEIIHGNNAVVPVGDPLFTIEVPDSPGTTQTSGKKDQPQLLKKTKKIAPSARRLASLHGVCLSTMEGNLISKDDVLKYVTISEESSRSKTTEAAQLKVLDDPLHIAPPIMSAKSPNDRLLKLSESQEKMKNFTKLSLVVPQLTYCEDIDIENLKQLKNQLKSNIKGVKFTYMPFFVKALSLSILDFPIINSILLSNLQEYLQKSSHNISFAMDTPSGLEFPCIKSVESKSVYQIALELNRLQQLGSIGKLSKSDLEGGTVTISNLGSIGGGYSAHIVYPPQVLIGAFGAIRGRLCRVNGEIRESDTLTTSWSADHRLLDGATTARFVARWKALIENPSLMLLHLK